MRKGRHAPPLALGTVLLLLLLALLLLLLPLALLFLPLALLLLLALLVLALLLPLLLFALILFVHETCPFRLVAGFKSGNAADVPAREQKAMYGIEHERRHVYATSSLGCVLREACQLYDLRVVRPHELDRYGCRVGKHDRYSPVHRRSGSAGLLSIGHGTLTA